MPEIIVKLGDNIVQKFFFVNEAIGIGRAADNEIVIENLAISRNHAVIKLEDGKYVLRDMDSSNGTYVNGVKVKRAELTDKDVVTLGKHKLFFYDQNAKTDSARRPDPADVDRTVLLSPETPAQLTVIKGRQKGQVIELEPGRTLLGKGEQCQIQISDWFVSKQHAEIEKQGDGYVLRDLNSWRHTRVNGEIIQTANLKNGDVIQLGPTVTLAFTCEAGAGAPALEEENQEAEVPQPDLEELEGQGEPRTEPEAGGDEWVKQYPHGLGDANVVSARDEGEVIPVEIDSDEADEDDAAAQAGEGGQPEGIQLEEGEAAVETPEAPDASAQVIEELAAYSVTEAAAAAMPPADAQEQADEPELTDENEEPADGAEESGEAEANGPEAEAETVPEDAPEKAPEEAVDGQDQVEAPAGGQASEPGAGDDAVAAAEAAGGDAPAENGPVDPKLAQETEMWERALKNPSAIIRKQAARRLKHLTGKDYEY